jgi:glycosyltransferase involved in cell wall biosynthesis
MSATAPFITVIICTRDRAASLRRALESLVVAAGGVTREWELLVVDNGSSDETPKVTASFADRLPLRRVFEGQAGLSNARNAGVRESRGEYIVWTDDDVVVDPDWLSAWTAGIEDRPDCAVFGGRALPVYEEPVQQWFVENEQHLRSLLAVRDSCEWREVDSRRLPYGLNYAIRAREQRRHPYDPALGVAPGRRLGGEEVAVIREILATGGRGCWVWGATVRHMIPASRQSVAYIRQYYRADGYQFPINGVRCGLVQRARGIARAGLVWISARRRIGLNSEEFPPADVSALVNLTRAAGSLRRHLGLRPG